LVDDQPITGAVLAGFDGPDGTWKVIALQRDADFVALVDLSLWPDDGRVRAPGATSKPGVPSKPYILNLCVEPDFRRQGLARRLMKVSERLIRDVWGDTEIYLHVEDDQVAANYLYEKIGYVPLKYTPLGGISISVDVCFLDFLRTLVIGVDCFTIGLP
jgi:ribosomal protein S18 acetylase RimI-like enzyme